jgi:predicted DNA-binding transcriptional regulator YafY
VVLPPALKPFLFDAGLLAPPSYHGVQDTVEVSLLRQAVREQRKVDLVYRDEQGKDTARVVWPIGIAYFDAQRLLIAWCELRQDFRSFRTDRMVEARLNSVKYTERRKALLKRWYTIRAAKGATLPYDAMA